MGAGPVGVSYMYKLQHLSHFVFIAASYRWPSDLTWIRPTELGWGVRMGASHSRTNRSPVGVPPVGGRYKHKVREVLQFIHL